MKSHVETLVEQWEGVVKFAKEMKAVAVNALQDAATQDSRTFYQSLFKEYDTKEKCAEQGIALYNAKYANMPLQPVYVFPKVA